MFCEIDLHKFEYEEARQAHQATFEGFLRAEANTPADGLETRADLLARTVQRAFENNPEPPEDTLTDLAAAVITLLTGLIDTGRTESGIPEN